MPPHSNTARLPGNTKVSPPIAVTEDLRKRKLQGAPLTDLNIARTIVLALPTNRSTARTMRCTVDALVSVARAAVESGAWMEGEWRGGCGPGSEEHTSESPSL